MAKKVSENDIQDMAQDWGLDTSNNLPFSGAAVQKFIKETFRTKMGYFHYDASSNRYLCFADEASKDKFVSNPTMTELVLGAFDAPSNYEARINLLSDSYIPVLLGTTGNYVEFTFDILNKGGDSTGEAVNATWTFIRGNNKQTFKAKYHYGQSVSLNVDKYLSEGTNSIIISIVGESTLASTSVSVNYQVVNLQLESDYDISQVYNLQANHSTVAEIPFTVSGYGTKIVDWYLDGVKLGFEQSVDEVTQSSASRKKLVTVSNLSQGKHSLQMVAHLEIDGQTFYSNLLYRDIIVYTGAGNSPIIALSASMPFEGKPVTGPLVLTGATQFVPYNMDFAVYNPLGATVDVLVAVDGVKHSTVIAESGVVNTFAYTPYTYGSKEVTFTAGGTISKVTLEVQKNRNAIQEITDSLELDLQSSGKSNSASDRDQWVYGKYTTSFTGFQWNKLSGWNDGALLITDGASIEVDFAPLKEDATNTGKTIEFEFATTGVASDDAVVCDLRDNSGTGILVTASEITLFSSGDKHIGRAFKSGENVRVSFVINKDNGVVNNGLAFIYINGIVSGSINFTTTDNFISLKNIVFSGSADASVILRSIRVYSKALSHDEILNNYMLYRSNVEEMMAVYNRNDIYEEGLEKFSMDKLANQLPVMIITGDIPSLEATTDKDKSIVVDVEYINYQNPEYSFTMKNAHMQPQGTSSMGYPKKNFRLYTQKRDDTKVFDADGKEIESRLYSFKEGAAPVNCWCMKADYAESSSTHNTSIARLWNDALKNMKVDDEYVCRTQAQQAAIDNDYEYDVRTTIDGFPIVMAYRLTATSDLVFIGKYNFNNDKETEQVFGFRDIPGFDNSNMQCWEVLNNGHHLALFQDTANFDVEWKDAFESRYPDTKNPDITALKAFATWLTTTTNFAAEKWQHLDVYKMAAYYVYVMRFGAVDQMVKNAMFTSEDGQKFYYINYDNDTINGLRNDGYLMYPPTITRQSLDESYNTEVYAYAGHDSTLWNSLESDPEFMSIVQVVDDALYNAGLTYANVIRMFDNEQSSKWCERVYNKDAQYKYISPFVENGVNNLFMIQGSRQSHRRWWLSKRFSFVDSMFVSGEFKSNVIETKLANAPAGMEFSIVAGESGGYGYGVNDVAVETGINLSENENHTFVTRQVLNVGDPLRLYSAPNIREIDLSGFTPYMSTLVISGVNSPELGTKLKKLKIGVDTVLDERRNTSLNQISGIEMASRLEEINVEGYTALTSLAVDKLSYLKVLKAYKSGLTGIVLAEGSPVELLELPETLKGITLSNATRLTQGGLRLEGGWSSLSSITIKKCPHFMDDFGLIKNWYDNKSTEDSKCSLVMEGIDWNEVNGRDLARIANIAQVGGVVSLKGTIRLSQASNDDLTIIREVFGDHVFNKGSELWITSNGMVVVTSEGDTIVEGKSMQFSAVVFSEHESGTVTYDIVGDTGSGVSINASTGLLTSKEDGGETVSFLVRAQFVPKGGGAAIAGTKRITLEKAVYPTAEETSIVGNNHPVVEMESYSWRTTTEGVNGYMKAEWTLSGDITSYYTINSQSLRECVLRKTAEVSGAVSGQLGLVLKKEGDSSEVLSITAPLIVKDATVMMTSLSNPEAMDCMYKARFAGNEIFMTYEEAAAVTDSQLQSGTSYSTSVFYTYGTGIKSFDEFQYFTGLSTVPAFCFPYCLQLTRITLPPQILKISENAFGYNESSHCGIDSITIPKTVETISHEAFAYCKNIKRINGGEGVTSIDSGAFLGVLDCSIGEESAFALVYQNTGKLSNKYEAGVCYTFLHGNVLFTLPDSDSRFDDMTTSRTLNIGYTGRVEDLTQRLLVRYMTLYISSNEPDVKFELKYTSWDSGYKEEIVSAGAHLLHVEPGVVVTIIPEIIRGMISPAETQLKMVVPSVKLDFNYEEQIITYIADANGRLYTSSEWTASGKTNDEAEGVCVMRTKSGGFVVSKVDFGGIYLFNSSVTVPGIEVDASRALLDMDGEGNTRKILNYGADSPAVSRCTSYIFPSGSNGYLPALGELKILDSVYGSVNSMMGLIGGTQIGSVYWSSNGRSSKYYYWSFYNKNYGSISSPRNSYNVRAFRPIYLNITSSLSTQFSVSYTNNFGDQVVQKVGAGKFYINAKYNTQVTVTPEAVADAVSEPQTFVWNGFTKECNFVFSKDSGVYIQHIDNHLYTPEEWLSEGFANNKANGVAVLSSFSSFVIAKNDASSSRLPWGGYNKYIEGVLSSTTKSEALLDDDGVGNTSKIIEQCAGYTNSGITGAPAAEACATFTFPNGKKGYLPSLSEWNVAYNNKSSVISAMSVIGGMPIKDEAYWSSTQYSAMYSWQCGWSDGSYTDYYRGSEKNVRAFTSL